MDQATHNKIVSFIWGIADDVLRDLFKRGKYPDVILPMCVIRRMDAVLEPTKQQVLATKKMLDEARITEQRAALCDAADKKLDWNHPKLWEYMAKIVDLGRKHTVVNGASTSYAYTLKELQVRVRRLHQAGERTIMIQGSAFFFQVAMNGFWKTCEVSWVSLRRARTRAVMRNPVGNVFKACLAAVIGLSAPAWPQGYPAKPIRIVVAFTPGGTSDVIARMVGAKLSERLGQQLIVDNRAGAGGSIGAEHVARSVPDGHTLMLGTSSEIVINPALNTKVGYDSARDFAPVTMIASTPLVLAVHPSMPVKSVRDFVALAKARPKAINYASSGTGTATHLSMELLKSVAAIDIVHVPYKGGPPGVSDLLAGHVQAVSGTPTTVLPFAASGRLRVLAATAAKRSPNFPDVPTVAESGFPGYEVVLWAGVLAPAGTPREIVTRLHGELTKILALGDVREGLARQGADLDLKSPVEFGAYIAAELKKWAKVVKDAGVKLE